MVDFEKLYKILFNSITDAVLCIDTCNYGMARSSLIKAQQDAENIFIEDGEE
jgi:hypothetical protein